MTLIGSKETQSININLCDFCFCRNFDTTIVKHRKYNTTILILCNRHAKCFICGNFFSNILPHIITNIEDHLANWSGPLITVDIGTKLPRSFIENEDYLRSTFLVRGKSNIKYHINDEIRKGICSHGNVRLKHNGPDCKFEISFVEDKFSVDVINKEHHLFGRYRKFRRGILQKKQIESKSVHSNSTAEKDHSSNESVELFIEEILSSNCKGDKVKIMWTGSEDKDSLVLGSGRPFLVKTGMNIQKIDYNKIYHKNGIEILFEDNSIENSVKLSRYQLEVKLLISVKEIINISEEFERLVSKFVGLVKFKMSNKIIQKKIYDSKFIELKSDSTLEIKLILDNGIPIKQLIGGLDPIEPSFSNYIGSPCECIYFDIVEVIQSA